MRPLHRERRTTYGFLGLVAALLFFAIPAAASAAVPTVTIDPPSAAYTTAHASGQINPNGGPNPIAVIFEYKEPSAEGWGATFVGEISGTEAEETTPIAIEADISGLTPGTEYEVRLDAFSEGVETYSAEPNPTFTTEAVAKPTVSFQAPGGVSSVSAEGAEFSGLIDPNAPQPEGSTSVAEQDAFRTSWHFQCTPACPEAGPGGELEADDVPHAVEAHASGLLPGTHYEVELSAQNAGGEEVSAPIAFETPAVAPRVTATFVSLAARETATLDARVIPGGSPTTYHFEYLSAAQFAIQGGFSGPATISTPESAPVGSDNTSHPVSAAIAGLTSATEYVYRVVASNSVDSTPGAAARFATTSVLSPVESNCPNEVLRFENQSLALPECRAYERVSGFVNGGEPNPPEVYVPLVSGAEVEPREVVGGYPIVPSVTGGRIAYAGASSANGGNGSSGGGLGNQFLATRGSEGWSAETITPPVGAGETGGTSLTTSLEGFTEDLGYGILVSGSAQLAASASPPGPEGALECSSYGLYARTPTSLAALFSATLDPTECAFGSYYAGSSQGGADLVFQAFSALAPGATPSPNPEFGSAGGGIAGCFSHCNLYLSHAGQLFLVNVQPGGGSDPDASFGSPPLSPDGAAGNMPDFDHVVSADGSRVFWTDQSTEVTTENPSGQTRLFARLDPTTASASTIQLDIPQGAASGEEGGGRFWTASPDGSRVYFTDESPLTGDSTATGGAPDLYEYDFSRPLGQRLRDLTVSGAGPANVQGVVGASEDGSYLYFVASGALAPGAEARNCEQAEQPPESTEEEEGLLPPGRGCNLYLLHAGQMRFVAALSARDDRSLGIANLASAGDWQSGLGSRTAQVTPDGRHLVFESTQRLTGFDPTPLLGADKTKEVFYYSADSSTLRCVSCAFSGGAIDAERVGGFLSPSVNATTAQRWMTADGQGVFFGTGQPLLPRDANGELDAYEWTPPSATGPCQQERGCLYLLSSGARGGSARYVGMSASGEDAFLITRARLIPGDHDERVDVYDIAAAGGFSQQESAASCLGEGCRGAGTEAAAAPPPASADAIDAQRQRKQPKCRHSTVRKHGKCVSKRKPPRHRKKQKTVGNHRSSRAKSGGSK